MKMKRMISLLMSLLMLVSLAACGEQPEQETQAAPEAPSAHDQQAEPEAGKEEKEPNPHAAELASPVLPAESLYPEIELDGLNGFTAHSLPVIYADLNGENRVYSPLNVYLALAMLAEVTDGDSRAQLLELLGEEDAETLRERCRALFEASYRDEELLTTLPAASVWLNDEVSYRDEALQALAEYYYASAFSGTMGDPAYTEALHDWINERTNHLLEEQAEKLSLDPGTVLALVTTLYFKGGWAEAFREELTTQDTFHAPSGDMQVDFMHNGLDMNYCRGEHFAAIRLSMYGGAGMWLLLPDEDSSLQELIDSGEAAAFLADPDGAEGKRCHVRISLPRFDVDSDMDLIPALQKLGVIDVFTPAADFSPLTGEMPLSVSQVEHAARVKIDEEGCEAAAFTAIFVKNAAAPDMLDEVEFTCDRPFFFAVTGDQGQILFTGAVNTPGK